MTYQMGDLISQTYIRSISLLLYAHPEAILPATVDMGKKKKYPRHNPNLELPSEVKG
jgi:hypothetical protein